MQRYCCLFATMILSTQALGQSSIAVNFAGGQHSGGPDIPDLLAADVAGVVAQPSWNNVARWSDTMNVSNGDPQADGVQSDLLQYDQVNETTTASTMDLSWDADNTWRSTKIGATYDNPDEQMMTGYIDVSTVQPWVSFTADQVPYDNYDIYVYVGGNGNDRIANVSLTTETLTPAETTIWYTTLTQNAAFTGPADYVQVPDSATEREFAESGNYVLYTNVQDASFTVQMTRPDPNNGNSGIHGFQVVQSVAPSILEIDMSSGFASFVGGDAIPVQITDYRISTTNGTLLPSGLGGLTALEVDPVDKDSPSGETGNGIIGDEPGENWEVVYADQSEIWESFLFGATTFDADRRLPLGVIYDSSFGEDSQLSFTYVSGGIVREGIVRFVPSSTPQGDYNGDGVVNNADYTVWRDSLGATGTGLPADGDGNEVVDVTDYRVWRATFGMGTAAPSAAGIGVPEPQAFTLVAALAIAVLSIGRSPAVNG